MKENLEIKKLFLFGLLFGFNAASGADGPAEDPRLVYFRQVQEVAAGLRKAATGAYGDEATMVDRNEFDLVSNGEMLLRVIGATGGRFHRASLITALGDICLYAASVEDGGSEFLRRVSGGINIEFYGAKAAEASRTMGWMYGGPVDPLCVVNLDGSKGRTSYDKFRFKRASDGGEAELSHEELAEKLVGRLVVPSCGSGTVMYRLKGYKGREDFADLVDRPELVWKSLERRYEEERGLKTDARKELAPLFDDLDD